MTVLIDLLGLAVVAGAALRGWRTGATTTVARLAGLVAGLLVGLRVAATLISGRLSPVVHLLLGLAVVIGCALVGSSLGGSVARAVHRAFAGRGGPAGVRPVPTADRAAGAALRASVAAGVCSLALLVVETSGPASLSAAVRSSAVASALAPGGRVLQDAGSRALAAAPDDIAALVPAAAATPPSASTAAAVAARVRTGVVEVLVDSCGSGVQGTGFAIGDGRVVTNAHVVRAADSVRVRTVDGTRAAATVIAFDAGSDLAVLDTGLGSPDASPLTVAGDVRNGTAAVVVGYPGGTRTTTPAAIVERIPMPGSNTVALHAAYLIRAPVRHGNSGSPLLDLSGRVVGVVNALSTADDDSGYATTASELRRVLSASAGRTTPVPTGTCTTEKGTR